MMSGQCARVGSQAAKPLLFSNVLGDHVPPCALSLRYAGGSACLLAKAFGAPKTMLNQIAEGALLTRRS